ncbi:LysR family transcriptional regulator [Ammoniphilus resinae]|uniref:DNA-binding transcriptional LysR family regulator n=1 Tax=Ammoniphilus resinae TaxID=861532 RepID=A0ABS4GMK7_9BACL|nr:LysR family transcriptional regulator [Ammoniphilus resinae]MBP1931297.1 DNA-binding transcriptional LysR family regulator [Ammoniphilus resinae]
MNTEQLHTFLVVCNCYNFSEAAKILFVPQPTVSNRIQYLEQELGVKLFIRGKRGVTLTEEGETFLPYAQQVINVINTAMSVLKPSHEENKIRIGSTIPFTYPLILKKIQKLSSTYKNLEIVLLNVDQSVILDKLTSEEIDTAFVIEPIFQRGIECHRIGKENIQVILSPQHPLAHLERPLELTDLDNENFIIYEPYSEIFKSYELINFIKNGKLLTNQIGVVKQLITQGSGIGLLPPFTIRQEKTRGELIHLPLNIEYDTIEYYLVCRKNERFFEDILFTDMTAEMAKDI